MAFGVCALDQDKFEQAVRYQALVELQLTRIVVSCTEPGAQAFVDGKQTVSCPGKEETLIRAGEHTITASKEGFETAALTRVFAGGKTEEVPMRLYRPEELTGYTRKFPSWMPYAVGGGGVLLLAVGGLLHASAASGYSDFDQWAKTCEAEQHAGCTPTSTEQGIRDSADTKQTIAFVGYGVGAAALAGGITLLILNRPKPYRIDVEKLPPPATAVVPIVGKDTVGVQASFSF